VRQKASGSRRGKYGYGKRAIALSMSGTSAL
jgi:hypothetical protein